MTYNEALERYKDGEINASEYAELLENIFERYADEN